jgi:hypothetical protein
MEFVQEFVVNLYHRSMIYVILFTLVYLSEKTPVSDKGIVPLFITFNL